MDALVKFSSKIDPKLLSRLRKLSDSSGRAICDILCDAVSQYLNQVELRPAFSSAAKEVLEENKELLSRLAK